MRQAMQRTYMELKTDVPDVAVSWSFIARFHVDGAKAVAANTASILALTALGAAAATVTTGITNPEVPRNVQIVGNAAGIAGNVTVHGTAYDDKVISEVLALNGTTVVTGSKAFKTITAIDLPAETAAGNEVSVGVGDALGLPFKLSFGLVLAAYLNDVREGTLPTVAMDAANIEDNTVTLNSALNGDDVDVFLVV